MTRTTADWEALLKDTTPGDWYVSPIGEGIAERPEILTTDENNGLHILVMAPLPNTDYPEHADKNLEAMAASKESLTEMIRLRKGLEALRAECKEIADNDGAGHDSYTPNEVAALIEETHYNALTRILNGETND